MDARAVICRMCHQKFFPASLKFHVKACAEREEHIELPLLQTHMTICRRAPARLKRPHTTQDLDNRRQQPKLATCRDGVTRTVTVSARHTEGITNPIPRQYMLGQDSMYPRHGKVLTPNYSEAFPKPVGGYSHDGIKNTLPNANIFSKDTTSSEDDGRVACTACKRKFSPDRVEVHQDICQRVNGTKGRGRRDEEGELSSFHKPRRSSCPTFRCNGVKTPWRRGCSVGRERDKNWWRTVRARVEGHGKCLERHLQKPDGSCIERCRLRTSTKYTYRSGWLQKS